MAARQLPRAVSFPRPFTRQNRQTIISSVRTITRRDRRKAHHITDEGSKMTNQDRIQARIARSKARREAKKMARAEQYGRIERVITNQNLFKSLMKRKKGTDWKQSVMDYCFHAPVRNKRAKDAILAGAHPEPSKIKRLGLYERGKRRDVHAVVIDSRVIQGVLCDNCITPLTMPGLILDNPASTKGKGVTWARNRIMQQLRRQYRKTGNQTWALVFDIRKFFDSIPHALCEKIFRDVHMDEQLTSLAMHFIKMYQVFDARNRNDPEKIAMLERGEGIGVSLGSQISQDLALCAPNALDHYVKDAAGIVPYMRYMDDGHAEGGKAELMALRQKLFEQAAALGFRLHETKTRIVKLSRGFIYLKIRYSATRTGHIIRRIAREGIVRMRRKLKKLHGLMRAGRVTLDDVFLALKSWLGNAKKYCHSYRTRKRILNLYHRLFRSYRMEGIRA